MGASLFMPVPPRSIFNHFSLFLFSYLNLLLEIDKLGFDDDIYTGERLGRGIVTDAITTPVVNTSAYFFKKTAELIDFKVR